MSEPQKRGRLSDMAVEALLKRIHSGELPVGTRLPSEPELAEEMGMTGNAELTYINTKTLTTPTGISLQSGVAFFGLVLAMGMMMLMFVGKRKEQN